MDVNRSNIFEPFPPTIFQDGTLGVPGRLSFMSAPAVGRPLPTGFSGLDFFGDDMSSHADSHIYEEVGPPELPPSLPPYYKKYADPWCQCPQCFLDYKNRADAGCYPQVHDGKGDIYTVLGRRDAGKGDGEFFCRSAPKPCCSRAPPCSTSLGFHGQFAQLPPAMCATPGRTRCPACDAGYLGSADSRPSSAACGAAGAQECCCAPRAAGFSDGPSGADRGTPYSEKRRGLFGARRKLTFRSLSPFPLLKRSSSCSSPTSGVSEKQRSSSGCSGDAARCKRRSAAAAVVVAVALLLSLAVGLSVTFAGLQPSEATAARSTWVLGSFRVTHGPHAQYATDLGANTSQMFRNWSLFMASQLDATFVKSNLSSSYEGAEVLRFRPGSVVVDFRLSFRQPFIEVTSSSLMSVLLPKGIGDGPVVYLPFNGANVGIDPASVSFVIGGSLSSLVQSYQGNTTGLTSVQPNVTSAGVCEPISVQECQRMYWNATGTVFPNFAKAPSQVSIQSQVSVMMLLNQRCYALWDVFVCATYVPRCGPASKAKIPPCRRLCQDALGGCKDWIVSLQLNIPISCNDFPDSSDPDVCVSNNIPVQPCPANTFRCDNTSCQPQRNRCDGAKDCTDGKDEADCRNYTCTADQFRCSNGACRPLSWVCDNHNDCGDNSDESGCQPNGNCPSNMFQCNKGGFSLWNETTNCIQSSYTCDGTRDCSDGSDEDPTYCRGGKGR